MRISDWSSDVCSSDLIGIIDRPSFVIGPYRDAAGIVAVDIFGAEGPDQAAAQALFVIEEAGGVIIFGHADQRLARERVVALDLRIRQRERALHAEARQCARHDRKSTRLNSSH